MTHPIRIWTCAQHHPGFRCGGWASVWTSQGGFGGMAGGARNTTGARTALAGLIAALSGLPATSGPAPGVSIVTNHAELAVFAALVADPEGATGVQSAPEDDLDLWAQVLAAGAGRKLQLTYAAPQPDSSLAFAAAWAALAMDKVKTGGPFTAAIPKSNLGKLRA